jgi:hypothetical protein
VALLTWVFADVKELSHVQLVQDAVDEVLLRIVPGAGYDPSVEKLLRERLMRYLYPAVTIKTELVDDLVLASSGKRRFVINRIGERSRAEAKG